MSWQKNCPYCDKLYKSKRFYRLHIKTHEEPKMVESTINEEPKEEVKIEKPKIIEKPKVKYRELVYLGTADKAVVIGAVTGKKYEFFKDKYRMPISTKVDEKDYPGIVALKGKGCARRDPAALYMSKNDWDLEIKTAREGNR